MSNLGCTIEEIEWNPDNQSSIVDELPTGGTVNIQLWIGAVDVTPVSSGCSEINGTGRYSWSIGNISVLLASRVQYHYLMTDGVNQAQGDFVLFSREARDGLMPSLNDTDSYILKI